MQREISKNLFKCYQKMIAFELRLSNIINREPVFLYHFRAKTKMSSLEKGKIISGTQISRDIIQQLKDVVTKMKNSLPNFQPGLAIVQVGDREDSNVYIRMKIDTAAKIGIKAQHIKLPRTITELEVLHRVEELNNDPSIHGIIVQMPLESDNKINSNLVTDAVSPQKDVDGLNTVNEGKVAIGELSSFLPCTPNGVIELIKRTGVNIAGATAVVLGRSKILGTPVAELLKWNHATVTVCHSKTKDLKGVCQKADILVVGIGQPELVKGSWIKPGAVVIDCGITAIPDDWYKANGAVVIGVKFIAFLKRKYSSQNGGNHGDFIGNFSA